jgi:hypothetical protein
MSLRGRLAKMASDFLRTTLATTSMLDHVAATGMDTALAGCGIKDVVTIRAMSVII